MSPKAEKNSISRAFPFSIPPTRRSILDLPDELLLGIIDSLMLPELEYFASLSDRLGRLCARRLAGHRLLQKQWRSIDRFTEEDWGWPYPHWFAFCESMLDLGTALYIEELDIDDCFVGNCDDAPIDYGTEDVALYRHGVLDSPYRTGTIKYGIENLRAEAIASFRKVVQKSPYILDTEKEQVAAAAVDGNKDAVFAVILPKLMNLKRLGTPGDCRKGSQSGLYTTKVVTAIAQEYPPRAMTQLHSIDFNDFNNHYAPSLQDTAPFLALPSVRTMSKKGCHEDNFSWPYNLPRSHVRKIEFLASSVTTTAARGLAKGIEGPCLIRQRWAERPDSPMPEPSYDWDWLEVPFKGAQEKDWVMKVSEKSIGLDSNGHPWGWLEEDWPEYARGLAILGNRV